jgi:hypothetical protein
MEKERSLSRKKFLGWGIAITSLFAVPSFFFSKKKNKTVPQPTAKMLTQDGKLVEVDLTKLSSMKQKIKESDIHTWVKNKPGF